MRAGLREGIDSTGQVSDTKIDLEFPERTHAVRKGTEGREEVKIEIVSTDRGGSRKAKEC
jgi:hypothetical protein